MSWNYAELSKAAKAAGGPEKLVEIISAAGKQAGHKEMIPLLIAFFGLGAIGTLVIQKIKELYFTDKKTTPEMIEAAKDELIQGINNYDAEQLDGEMKTKEENVIYSPENEVQSC